MHVIFVEPAFPLNQREFVRALHEADEESRTRAVRTADASDLAVPSFELVANGGDR